MLHFNVVWPLVGQILKSIKRRKHKICHRNLKLKKAMFFKFILFKADMVWNENARLTSAVSGFLACLARARCRYSSCSMLSLSALGMLRINHDEGIKSNSEKTQSRHTRSVFCVCVWSSVRMCACVCLTLQRIYESMSKGMPLFNIILQENTRNYFLTSRGGKVI